MTSYSLQTIGPVAGVLLPNVPKVPTVPTPSTNMNIVNRSQIVVVPPTVHNNLGSISNILPSSQVYLDTKEKIQNKSFTDSNYFSLKTQPLDHFSEKSPSLIDDTWKEEFDEEVIEEVNESMKTLERALTMPDGMMNVRRCKKYVAQLKLFVQLFTHIIDAAERLPDVDTFIPLVPPTVPPVPSIPRVPPTLPPVPSIPLQIIKPTDYCHEHPKLAKIGRSCPDCQREKSITFCQDLCGFCRRKTKAYERAEDRLDSGQFLQIIKTERVNDLRARVSTGPIIPVPQSLLPSLQLNRSGNFLDKFLAVTFTLKDTDLTSHNILFLEQQLILNFNSFTCLKDFPCKGSVYVLEYTKALVPHLHGIVRLSTHLKKDKHITVKNSHFDGKNKITLNGRDEPREDKVKILLKPLNVSGWIAYMQKHYIIPGHREFVGDLANIISGWDYQPSPPISPF